jgi:4-hydroxy-tetrahydrodipicolinate synthase
MTKDIIGNQALLVTPMTDEGQVDEPSLRRLIDFVVERKPHGVLLLGSTGEFFTLTESEQDRVTKIAAEQVAGRVALGYGAANTAIKLAVRTAEKAQQAGADYLLIPPPYYAPLAFGTDRGTYTFFKEIADSTDLQVMLYDGGSGIEISLDNLGKLSSGTKNIRHVKVNVAKPTKIPAIQGLGMRAFCGLDPATMPMMRYGADGFTLGVGNCLPQESSAFFDDCRAGNWTSAETVFYDKMLPIINATLGYLPEFIAAFKLILHWMGVISSPAVRAPLMPIDVIRQREIRAVAHRCGLVPA